MENSLRIFLIKNLGEIQIELSELRKDDKFRAEYSDGSFVIGPKGRYIFVATCNAYVEGNRYKVEFKPYREESVFEKFWSGRELNSRDIVLCGVN